MSSELQKKLPDAIRYIPMIVEALRAMNGVGRAAAVKDWIAESMEASHQTIPDTILAGGASKFANDIQWARMYLVNAGMIEPKKTAGHGIWKLTPSGWDTVLSPEKVKAIYEVTALKGKVSNAGALETQPEELFQAELDGMSSWESVLKSILTTMPDKGFERLCAFIMARNGLQATKVTGQTGDGGVDGEGMLAFDKLSLIKTPVAWQCKRYKEKSVSTEMVRDFRGAIEGRAKYGLIFTTSSFTTSADVEARRPGATPIELVGLERLIELMAQDNIGVTKATEDETAYTVCQAFFDEYLHPVGGDSAHFSLV